MNIFETLSSILKNTKEQKSFQINADSLASIFLYQKMIFKIYKMLMEITIFSTSSSTYKCSLNKDKPLLCPTVLAFPQNTQFA